MKVYAVVLAILTVTGCSVLEQSPPPLIIDSEISGTSTSIPDLESGTIQAVEWWSGEGDDEPTPEEIANFTSTEVIPNHRTRECRPFSIPGNSQEVLIYSGIDPIDRTVIGAYTGDPCIVLLGTKEINNIKWGKVLHNDKLGFIKRREIRNEYDYHSGGGVEPPFGSSVSYQ